jgi:predicted site-specific integrase-resolvase
MDMLMIGRAAEELGVSVDRLRDWCKLGWAPHTLTLGGRYRFTREQMNEIKDSMGIPHEDATQAGPKGRYRLVRS